VNVNSTRHPGGRTCAGMAVLVMAVPALLAALVVKSLKRKGGK
jgi:hypothetical protein